MVPPVFKNYEKWYVHVIIALAKSQLQLNQQITQHPTEKEKRRYEVSNEQGSVGWCSP